MEAATRSQAPGTATGPATAPADPGTGRVRRALRALALAALLVGPTALAFFAGGYFDSPRVWAGLIAWLLVAVAMIISPRPLPRSLGPAMAILGLGLLAAWTLLSMTWAPIAGSAYHAGQLVLLYAGVLIAATALLRTGSAQRAVEPALAGGTVIVIGYGLAGRMLPGVLHYAHSVSAQGRLEQPLTYWNAIGELAALGLVLAVRLTGDATRPRWIRLAAAASSAPLGMALYMSFSRGALFACAAGLVVLVVVAPTTAQLRGLVVGILAAAVAAAASAPFRGVTSLQGSPGTLERQGAVVLVALVVISAAAAVVAWRAMRGEPGSNRTLKLPRLAPLIAVVVICAGLALAVVAGAKEKSASTLAAGASRYETLQSNRYDYWRVAWHVFKQEPIRGVGAGGWAVAWLRLRTINEGAQDAHSLPLQTAAELGLVGVALLVAFLGGVAVAARRAYRVAPPLAAGPIAAFVVYVAHAPLDWDWEMPAVTLVALILAGSLLALSEWPASRREAAADHEWAYGVPEPARPG
jgi:O-Antigen ligase